MRFSPETLIEQCRRVTAASDLRIDDDQLAALARDTPDERLTLPRWDDAGMYDGPPPKVVAWLLAYNAINFCYWPDEGPRWWTVVDGLEAGRDDEALGIMVAFARALDRGVPLDDGRWLMDLDLATLREVLGAAPGAGALPLMGARVTALRELGAAYVERGGAMGLLDRARGSALALVDEIVDACPGWEDARDALGETVRFRKRAQLCVAMLHGRFQGRAPAAFPDVDQLTAFADYRLPQVLRGAGVLVLPDELSHRIGCGIALPMGSPEEISLRAATIWACERLRLLLRERKPDVSALVVDHLLWRSAVELQDELPTFHRTRTTDY